MELNASELMVIEDETSDGTSGLLIAYVLWLFAGILGAHRFFLGRTGTAALMLCTVGGAGIWWLIDAFLMPEMVRARNAQRREELMMAYLAGPQAAEASQTEGDRALGGSAH